MPLLLLVMWVSLLVSSVLPLVSLVPMELIPIVLVSRLPLLVVTRLWVVVVMTLMVLMVPVVAVPYHQMGRGMLLLLILC